MKEPVYVAADIGATGIKIVAAAFDGARLEVKDTYSVKNDPVVENGCEYADIGGMLSAVREGLRRFGKNARCISLGIDTYGNGYGMLDKNGCLVMKPHHYRDRRIDSVMPRVHEYFTDWQLYEQTGNYPIKTRGLFHLYQDVLEQSANIKKGTRLLPLPNLLEYLITGEEGSERTIASVLYLLEKTGADWNFQAFEGLGIPKKLFGPLSEPGVKRGVIREEFAEGGEFQGIPVITVAGHDTESALLAIPELDESKVFVSMGTSFVFGARVRKPVVNKDSFRERFKNMRGAFGTYSLCKDVPGFWILERCMERWKLSCPKLDYGMVCDAVKKAEDNYTFLDISDDRFRVSETDIIQTIYDYCSETGQRPVEGMQQTARCLFESYALYIRWSIERISRLTGITYKRLEAMNGGVRNKLLLQMFADASGIPVAAQSPWASACGNLLLQLYAAGEADSQEELGRIAFYSCGPVIYKSNPSPYWEERLQYMKQKGLFKEVQ